MMTKVSALVAFAALATATKDHGGACSVVTITGTATIPTTTKTSTSTVDNCSTRTVCIDKVNECGMWYGGCVPDCKPWPTFSKPACPTTTKTTSAPTTTSTADNCSTRTVCIDLVNECGMWYGGCVPDCKPWPTFSKPQCPPSSTTTTHPTTTHTTTATVPTGTTSVDNCSTRSICADYVNSCGMWYGGCFPDCKPWPTFTPPPCPSTTTLITSVTATSK